MLEEFQRLAWAEILHVQDQSLEQPNRKYHRSPSQQHATNPDHQAIKQLCQAIANLEQAISTGSNVSAAIKNETGNSQLTVLWESEGKPSAKLSPQ